MGSYPVSGGVRSAGPAPARVYIGAGLALYRATQQTGYPDDANRTAAYVLNDGQARKLL